MEELVLKWRNVFGWQDYIDGIDEELLALKMEETARYILDLPYQQSDTPIISKSEKMIETCIFPIILRVMKKQVFIGDVPSFYNDLLNFLNLHRITIGGFDEHPLIDIEAEMCALFVEDYVERKRDPIIPRKFIKKWGK